MKQLAKFTLLFFILIFSGCSFGEPTVAFYRVPENVRTEIIATLNMTTGKKHQAIILDNQQTFSSQKKDLKNASILIALKDFEIDDFAVSSRVAPLPAAYLTGMPYTIAHSVVKQKNVIKTIPVLYDFYILDVNYPLYKRTKVPTIDYWSDFIRAARVEKNFLKTRRAVPPVQETSSDSDKAVPLVPIFLPVQDDETLINMLGMFTEAFLGSEDYNEILVQLYSTFKKDDLSQLSTLLTDLTTPGGQLYPVVMEIQKLLKEDLLATSSNSIDNGDSPDCFEDFAMLFTTLSDHRKLFPAIGESQIFVPVYCPAYQQNDKRHFVAPEFCAMALNSSKATARSIVAISSTYQTQLSTATGLVPVQAKCSTSDEIAENIRYWLSASEGPLPPFTAALPSQAARHHTAQYIRNLLVSLAL